MSLCKCIEGLTPLVFMVCGCASILFDETCYLFVRVIDVDGRPVPDATVSVSALQTCAGWYVDSETDYGHWFAKTDSNGIAKVEFACINGRFTWSVRKVPDGYHPFKNYYTVDIPCRTVESDYLYLDPKTKQGRAMLRELRELEEKGDFDGLAQKLGPKSCSFLRNRFHRVATIYPKRNPDSMYGHSSIWGAHLPPKGSVESNGLEVAVSLPPAEFDLKYARFLPPVNECKPPKEGLVADFRVVRQLVETNDGRILKGYIEFPPGCGACKYRQTGCEGFPAAYSADPSEAYSQRIPFVGEVVVAHDEYLVLRTRPVTNEVGEVSFNYSKIVGRFTVSREDMNWRYCVFNPRNGDMNLELDVDRNLDEHGKLNRCGP